MGYVFSGTSKNRLTGLRPELIEVNERALGYGLMDFTVVRGVATLEQQGALYAQGREPLDKVNERRKAVGWAAITARENAKRVTWTMNSNHLLQQDGYGHAYDVAPYFDGAIQWNDIEAFNFLATLHLRAAMELGVRLGWGGHWTKNIDRPHFELLKGV